MVDTGLRERLRAVADLAGTRFEPPDVSVFVERRRRRNRRIGTVAAAATTVVVVAVAAAMFGGSAGRTARPAVAVRPGQVSAADLGRYHWVALPEAPIAGRGEAAVVWTGTQMIVWGGSTDGGSHVFGDGASYDPASRDWQKLPSSPLTARSDSAATFADGSLFIWGGWQGINHWALDGALYDPTTHTWHKLPAAPVTNYGWAQAYWTGQQVILLNTPEYGPIDVVRADAYDPQTSRWTTLPDLSLPAGHATELVRALAADTRIFVWVHWSHTVSTGPNSSKGFSGIDGYTLDTSTDSWSANHLVPAPHVYVDQPVWTGRDIVLPAGQVYCGACDGPFAVSDHGYLANPDADAIRALPTGPVDALLPRYVWTGAALLAFDPTVYTGTQLPGAAAALDPTANRWADLPRAPLTGTSDQVVAVWTGRSLIEWGAMRPSNNTNPELEPVQTAGLVFQQTA
jgi:hypothetical protein